MAPGVTEFEKWSLGRGWVSSRTLQPQARAGGSSSSAIVLTAAVGQGPSLQDSGQTIGRWKPSPPGVSGCYSHRQGRRRNSISESPNKRNPNYDPVREKRWCNYFSVDVKSLVKSLLLLCWDSVQESPFRSCWLTANSCWRLVSSYHDHVAALKSVGLIPHFIECWVDFFRWTIWATKVHFNGGESGILQVWWWFPPPAPPQGPAWASRLLLPPEPFQWDQYPKHPQPASPSSRSPSRYSGCLVPAL